MQYRYKAKGVCADRIDLEVNNGIIDSVRFYGGCDGNANGLSSLLKGMRAEDVIKRLEGTRCGYKNTSCPDQLAKALKEIQNGQNN
ncbi:MAG TPA: TIGR03905 family TSCPD domain-containing protein [Clostridia bacterium]|jgi:uncharacterized protein (TIGR03905 family)|nr:TIGR03905 family TSCPD domain-containing protein [Clostridia bacterium]